MDNQEGNVISLTGDALPPDGEPKESVVRLCEELLDLAKAGRLVGLGVVRLDDQFKVSWTLAGDVGGFGMVGAAYRVMGELDAIANEGPPWA